LIHGLIYVFLLPAWQHYDEPNHFEYVWLVANRGKLPVESDYDRAMRLEVAQSMIDRGFFNDLGFLPDLNNPDQPIWIGPISQLNNQPLYYLIAALPVRFLLSQSVESQLVAARLVSLGFLLVTLLAAWGVMLEIAPDKSVLRLYLPLTLAMLPGFSDVMTAVNNDAAAIGLVSLSLWGSIRMVRRGIRVLELLVTLVITGLCLLTKETAYVAVPVFLLALLFAAFRDRFQWIPWVLIGVGLVVTGVVFLSTGDASAWYRSTAQESASRVERGESPLGKNVFRLESKAPVTPGFSVPFYQPIPVFAPPGGGDKTYTVGAWVWADEPVKVRTPTLGNGNGLDYLLVDVGIEPTFFAFTTTVPTNQNTRLWVGLNPDYEGNDIGIYYDGLVVVDGSFPTDVQPTFEDTDGNAGTWGGVRFENLLRNASAERGGLRVTPWVDNLGARFLPDQTRPSSILAYLVDWQGVTWHYRLTIERLLRTFWAKFGWAHISLMGSKPYQLLAVISAIGITGFVVWISRQLKKSKGKMPWNIMVILAFQMLIVWGGTISRGVIYLGNNRLYLPVARYAYTAIIPTMLILTLGWLELLNLVFKWKILPQTSAYVRGSLWLGLLLILDIWSILSIYRYYMGS
jgi:hypothetical protein